MLFWATRVMLWSGLCYLYRLIESIGIDPTGGDNTTTNLCTRLPDLGHRTDFIPLTRNVFQSVEYCLKSEMLVMGMFAVCAPLNIVIGTIRHNPEWSRQTAWGKAVLDKVQKRLRIVKLLMTSI